MNDDGFFNFFFDKDSFWYELVEGSIWNIEKYWVLEKKLIDIIKDMYNKHIIFKNLARNLYYLSYSIQSSIQCSLSANDFFEIENLDVESVLYYRDRLDLIINILWNNHNYLDYDSFFSENPKYIISL
ncbi:hypothetical protein [Moraxella marmotae]|uniref:hypothetical protein n=1 Tax=Moraxella marmotae TaxID=3344520 RepID=UPI0035F2B8CF